MVHLTQTSPAVEQSKAEGSSKTSGAAQVAPKESSSANDPATVLGLNRGDRRVVSVLIVFAVALMCVQWYRLTQSRPAPIVVLHPEGYTFQLDVNEATWVEWMQLDRVGETLARRIVEDREERGPFASVDDVSRVKGIGPKTLESLRAHLECAPQSDHETD